MNQPRETFVAALGGNVALKLKAAAEARACRPGDLATALVRLALESDALIDNLLDGDDPAVLAREAFDWRATKLSMLRASILYCLALGADSNGYTSLSGTRLSRMTGGSQNGVAKALHWLIDEQLIDPVCGYDAAANRPAKYRLTTRGRAFAATLGGPDIMAEGGA